MRRWWKLITIRHPAPASRYMLELSANWRQVTLSSNFSPMSLRWRRIFFRQNNIIYLGCPRSPGGFVSSNCCLSCPMLQVLSIILSFNISTQTHIYKYILNVLWKYRKGIGLFREHRVGVSRHSQLRQDVDSLITRWELQCTTITIYQKLCVLLFLVALHGIYISLPDSIGFKWRRPGLKKASKIATFWPDKPEATPCDFGKETCCCCCCCCWDGKSLKESDLLTR